MSWAESNMQIRATSPTLRLRITGMDRLLLPLRSRGACAAGRRGRRLPPPPPPPLLFPTSASAGYLPTPGLPRGGSELTELRFGKERCGKQSRGCRAIVYDVYELPPRGCPG